MSRWRAAAAGELERIAAGLRRREWAYVPFSSRLRAAGERPQWPRRARAWSVVASLADGSPASALLITRSGLVLPALRDGRPLPPEVRSMILGYSNSPFSVMGTLSDVRRVQELLGYGDASVDYRLMTVDAARYRPPAPESRCAALRIQRARPGDARKLYELQRAYELEEVLLEPSRFSRQDCLRRLHASLRSETGYYGTIDGRPVTKASTNGRGYAVDQIGGVYTEPGQRRRGFSRAVMTILLEELFAAGRSATLFVKLENAAAVRLYHALGFVERDRYRICYYCG